MARLFAQIPPPGSLKTKAVWYWRAAIARMLFDQAVISVAGKVHLRPLRKWVIDAAQMRTSDAMSEHLRALSELPFKQEARELVATMTLYRRLQRAMVSNDLVWAADLRLFLNAYPEDVRHQGRMLHMLTMGLMMRFLPPGDLEFIEEMAKGSNPVLPPKVIRQRAAMIRARPGMTSAA